jgi:hypothetical protein
MEHVGGSSSPGKKEVVRSLKLWTPKPMLLFSTPDAPGVKETSFPEGVGSGFERIYGVHGTTNDFRFLWLRFATKSSVDAFDPGKSARRAQEEPNERER